MSSTLAGQKWKAAFKNQTKHKPSPKAIKQQTRWFPHQWRTGATCNCKVSVKGFQKTEHTQRLTVCLSVSFHREVRKDQGVSLYLVAATPACNQSAVTEQRDQTMPGTNWKQPGMSVADNMGHTSRYNMGYNLVQENRNVASGWY